MSASNDHYGLLNNRFDHRSEYLRSKGFRYEFVEAFGSTFGVFVCNRPSAVKPTVVVASCVMHSDEFVWADRCGEIERL